MPPRNYLLAAVSLVALVGCQVRTPASTFDITGTWNCRFSIPGVVETATMTFAADGTVRADGVTRLQTPEGEMLVAARRRANWRLEGNQLMQADTNQQIVQVLVGGSALARDAPQVLQLQRELDAQVGMETQMSVAQITSDEIVLWFQGKPSDCSRQRPATAR